MFRSSVDGFVLRTEHVNLGKLSNPSVAQLASSRARHGAPVLVVSAAVERMSPLSSELGTDKTVKARVGP